MATKAHLEGNKRYLEKLDELKIRVTKGKKATLQDHAAVMGESLNAFANRAIDETVERDNKKGEESVAKAYEGYLERGQIYALRPLINTQGRRRVIITVLDEPIPEEGKIPQVKAIFDTVNTGDAESLKDVDERLKDFGTIMQAIDAAADEEMPPLEPIRLREVEL